MFNLKRIQTILDADVLAGEEKLDMRILHACGSDLMSDVLAFTKENTLLLTGLTNFQVVRTADVSGLSAIVFVRGKVPREDVLEGANEIGVPILVTKHPMYTACGLLYKEGLLGGAMRGSGDE